MQPQYTIKFAPRDKSEPSIHISTDCPYKALGQLDDYLVNLFSVTLADFHEFSEWIAPLLTAASAGEDYEYSMIDFSCDPDEHYTISLKITQIH